MELIPPESFSDDLAIKCQYYLDNTAGRYHSNWHALRMSAVSSYVNGVESFGDLLASWKRAEEKGQARAEAQAVLWFNYQIFAMGPLLSTIVMSSFALESFLRTCLEIMLWQTTKDAETLQLAVSGFDNLPFRDRINRAIAAVGAPALKKSETNKIDALIEFRNSCAHDSPILFGPTGHLFHIKRGRLKQIDETKLFKGLYPGFHNDIISVTPKHAKLAYETHDLIVAHVETHGTERFRKAYNTMCSNSRLGTIGAVIPSNHKEIAENQVSFWEDVVAPWQRTVPRSEHEEVFRQLARRGIEEIKGGRG